MIPVMYGQSEMCMATMVFYTCILVPLARAKQRLTTSSLTLLATLFSYTQDSVDQVPPAVSADEWLEANTAESDPFTSSSSSSCGYEDEQDRVASAMKQLLAAESTTATSEEEDSCSICLAELADTSACRLSRCKHVFHLECIEKWVERDHFTCPLCRNFIFLP